MTVYYLHGFHLNDKHLPNRALVILTIIGVLIGSMFPFAFLAQLISAGTLVAFMFVSLAMYRLRNREGKDHQFLRLNYLYILCYQQLHLF